MGHRYLVRNQPKEAKDFFRAALADAAGDATLQKLARAALERLKGK
jgi:hypothetical protein